MIYEYYIMENELLDKSQSDEKKEQCICEFNIHKCGIAFLCFMIGGSFSFVIGYHYFQVSLDSSESGDVIY